MKALLDMPVSISLLDVLRAHGHEGVHANEVDLNRAADSEILERLICVVDAKRVRITRLPLTQRDR